jgi:hypothetical protein
MSRSDSFLDVRFAAGLLLVGSLLAVSGCYGSTEPATNIGPEGATLNARGTANSGAATSRFEYWISGTSARDETVPRHWPAGARGPFSATVSGLYASRTYFFRLCGRDDASASDICAQTRRFTTGAPVRDSVVGSWGQSSSFYGNVDAHSGPAGQNPSGTVSARASFDSFTGNVTCLIVSGSTAKLGAVGHTQDSSEAKETMLLSVADGGPSGTDGVTVIITPGSTAPNCANAPMPAAGNDGSQVVINDAP